MRFDLAARDPCYEPVTGANIGGVVDQMSIGGVCQTISTAEDVQGAQGVESAGDRSESLGRAVQPDSGCPVQAGARVVEPLFQIVDALEWSTEGGTGRQHVEPLPGE